jgi:hypothetical protein
MTATGQFLMSLDRLAQIGMNARDDSAVGRFWAEALGWVLTVRNPV